MKNVHVVQVKNTRNAMENKSEKIGKFSEEKLGHFNCYKCKKWWTIGDIKNKKSEWFCPWCGEKQTFV